MGLRKEQIVFGVVLLFVAYKANGLLASAETSRRGSSRAEDKQLVAPDMPDVALALPEGDRSVDFDRNLFEPPSPTQPLPPLAVDPPRFDALPALAPPTSFGPGAAHHGALLRRPAQPASARPLPGLFADLDAYDPGAGDLTEFEDLGLEEIDPDDPDAANRLPDDPEERAARIAGFKQQYDWIYRASYMFGRIENDDRYTLALDDTLPPGVALRFVQVDPFTGRALYGDNALEYTAEDIREFGLRDTPLTRIEVGYASFPETLPSTRVPEALRFAEECLQLRNETPRALEVAEEMYRRAQAVNTQDSIEPRLGLARCYELAFRLDDASAVYRDLLASGFAANGIVHARLGDLQARLRLDAAAEASLRRAVDLDAGSWEVRWRLGSFLASRGRYAEAEPNLAAAVDREPRGVENRRWRVRVRLDHATALMQLGRVDEALEAFQRSLSADPDGEEGLADVCRAGVVSAARLADSAAASAALAEISAGDDVASGGFDSKLGLGLLALDEGRFEEAAALLLEARGLDPFRAYEADRALSRVAEITDNPEEADAFAADALAGNPRDPWTLYQVGRLAEAAGDTIRARAAFQAAVELELAFTPAIARLARLLEDTGDVASAERYYERATDLEPGNAQLWARRGWNALAAGDLALAETSFRTARDLSPGSPSARAGLAWWRYATGDSGEALILLGEIVDDARSDGTVGPWSEFAEAEAERILDHDSKEVFRDRFDRANGRIANNWIEDKGVGPLSDLVDGAVRITGSQTQSGRTRVFRELPPDRFLAFSCELTVGPEARGTRAGVFLSMERPSRTGAAETRAEIAVCRNRDGEIEVRVQAKATDGDAPFRVTPGPPWPVGEPVRIAIQRSGEDLASRFTIYVDGEPVLPDIQVDSMMSSRQNLRFGVFTEGDPGRVADLTFEDARVVRRK